MKTALSPYAHYLRRMRSSSVYNVAIKSPLEEAALISKSVGCKVWLKREDLQPVYTFKLRGAYNRMACLSAEELDQGVLAASAGNHALGVAYAARELGTKATIVVPVTTPQIKADAICALGAELISFGDNFDEAYAYAEDLAKERKLTLIHPYDHPDVIVGQGTVGIEICDQLKAMHEPIEAVFVPVGGGGLIAGVALAVKQLMPGVKVIGVEPRDSDAFNRSLAAGKRVVLSNVGLFADGLAVHQMGELTFEIARELVDEVITVTADEMSAAIKEIFEDRRAVVEPSGAVALAGLKKWMMGGMGETRAPAQAHGFHPCHPEPGLVAILSGANLNFDRLQFIAERAKVGNQTEGIIAVQIPERPGAFQKLCKTIGERQFFEFNYRKSDERKAVVFVAVSVHGIEDRKDLIQRLNQDGYETLDITDDEVAKLHVRHMVGGPGVCVRNERLFHVHFAERVGALGRFLDQLGTRWNISLFHYRNHGSDRGRALVGFEVIPAHSAEFETFINEQGIRESEETMNQSVKLFLGEW